MRIFFTILSSILLLGTSLEAQVISPRLSSSLNTATSGEEISVIVTLADKADLRPFIAKRRAVRMMGAGERRKHRAGIIRTLKTKADLSQQRLIRFLKNRGTSHIKPLWIINGIALKASPEVIQMLAAMPEVASIRPDAVVYLPEVVPAATDGVENNLITINAPDLWVLGFKGQGMVVALLDSGVDSLHPDLAMDPANGSGWRGGTNSWFNPIAADCGQLGANCTLCDENVDTPCDFVSSQDIAHGTGVAGIMTGSNAGGTSIGVAPAAQWIAAKIFKSDGEAPYSAIHQALQWALDPDGDPATDDAPDVVNNSWGLIPDPLNPADRCFTEFLPAIQALKAAGIAVVFSSGNEGSAPGTDVSPANYLESFAVGSVGTALSATEISGFSSRGPSTCDGAVFPEVVAPGFRIRSADFTINGVIPNSYTLLSGTSFAAPHVAGVMTLLLQAFPGVPLADLEDAIKFSAVDLGNLGPDNDYGFGLIDALAAYDWLIQAPNISSTDPDPPANDRHLDFGEIAPSVVSRQTIVFSNSGRGELQLGTLLLTGDSVFTLSTDGCTNQTLTGGQSCDLIVEFSSATDGTFAGGINVPSNDFDEATLVISLVGIVSDPATPTPRLVITDSVVPTGDRNIPFGVVLTGSTRSESLQMNNDDLGPLMLGPLDSSALDGTFSVVSDGCSAQTLAFGESCIVGIDFNPVDVGSFSGILSIPSNDPTTPLSQITVSGTGEELPPPPSLSPRLVITDSVIPTSDRNIPFGVVLTGSVRSESLQMTNDDLGPLILGPLDSSALDGTFSVVSDGCLSQTLAFGESCVIGIDFNPVDVGSFSGILSIPSNDPATPLSQITVSGTGTGIGTGNNPPPVPSLISPILDASNLSVPVEFSWNQLPDPDGDTVVNNLYVSEDPTFTDVVPILIASHNISRNALPAGLGGLLILSGLLARRKREVLTLRMLCLAFALIVLASCGGGGSSTGINPNIRSYSVSNLSTQTIYHWKVTADDGNGGTSESFVSNFTTK